MALFTCPLLIVQCYHSALHDINRLHTMFPLYTPASNHFEFCLSFSMCVLQAILLDHCLHLVQRGAMSGAAEAPVWNSNHDRPVTLTSHMFYGKSYSIPMSEGFLC